MQPMAMAPPPTKRKGGGALWIGIVLVVLGIAGGIIGLVAGFRAVESRIDEMQRVSLIQGGTITLDAPGTYKVFAERPTSGGGSATAQITGPDGAAISIDPVAGSEEYDVQGRNGTLLGTISAPTAGSYQFVVAPDVGLRNGGGQFAVGKRSPGSALIGLGVALLGGIAAVVVGIILIIVGAVRRSRSKRPPTSYPQGGWGPAPSGAPAPGGWAPPPGQPWTPPGGPGAMAPPPSGPPAALPWSPPQTGGNTTWNPPPPSS